MLDRSRFADLAMGVAGLLLSGAINADTLNLSNGDRLTGSLNSVSGGHVVLETEYAGKVVVSLSAISRIESDKTFEMRMRDGVRQVGKFSVANDAQEITDASGETVGLSLENIASAGQNKLSITDIGSDWASRADLAAEKSRGNTDTQSVNLLIETVLKRNTVEHAFSLQLDKQEDEEETTREQFDFDYGYKRFVSDKWFASGNGEYFQDELKDIDSRITLGAGVGYQFWDNSFGSLSADLGASYVMEELAGESEDNPALRWSLKYDRNLWGERVELFHKHSILFIIETDRGEVLKSSTGVRLAINSRLSTSLRVDVDHETEPVPGAHKTDVTYALGIGVKF